MTAVAPTLFETRPAPPGYGRSADHAQRKALYQRFANRLVVRPELTRRLVSYQGNKQQPGFRWMRYKEGFSADLVASNLESADGAVLDPFAGIGTTALVAAGSGRRATAVEIMPVGVRTARAVSSIAGGIGSSAVEAAGAELLRSLKSGGSPPDACRFQHVPITEHAFPSETEYAVARARAFLDGVKDEKMRLVLDTACMSVLEEVSYTARTVNTCGGTTAPDAPFEAV